MGPTALIPSELHRFIENRQWGPAAIYCEKGVTAGDPRSGFWRGALLMAQGQDREALPWLTDAESRLPESSEAAFAAGVCCQRIGCIDAAITHWQRALMLDPDHPQAQYNIAKALADTGDDAAAADGYRRLIAACPDHDDARYNLANRLLAMDRPYEAIAWLAPLRDATPTRVDAWINSGLAWKSLGQYPAAEACYRRALQADPASVAAHWNLAHLLLVTGRWREGFAHYEWRLHRDEAPTIVGDVPEWDGRTLHEEPLLVWAEQGIGDAIQFFRYVPAAAERVGRLILYCHPGLVPLARTVAGPACVMAFGDPIPPVSAHVPLVSLAHRLGRPDPVDTWRGPYVRAGASVSVPRIDGCRRVGLAWAGNPTHANDRRRSMAPEHLAPLLDVPGFQWFSFQINGQAALSRLGWADRVVDLSDRCTDFAATAALAVEMDLMISVDTAMAHLAGALGRPVWLMTPHAPDWRWPVAGRRTAWYPAMRLFRQHRPGRWSSVVADVASALTVWHHMGGSPNALVDGPLGEGGAI